MTQNNREIILIPGLMGTTLKLDNLTIWPVASIKNHHHELNYNRNPNLEHPEIVNKFYGPLRKYLANEGFKVTTFPYDWRANNLTHLERLREYLERALEDVVIVAHSMGGIILKLFLNHFKEDPLLSKIKDVITLGTPWSGSPYAYKAIKYGINIPEKFPLVMHRYSSRDVARSSPSLYQLLPNRTYFTNCSIYQKKHAFELEGKPLTIWDDALAELYLPLLKRYQGEGKVIEILQNFIELLDMEMPIKHHEVIGYGLETTCTIKENKLGEPKGEFDNGDGTVPIISAMSNNSFKYFVKEGHNKLPRNSYIMQLIKNIISGQPEPNPDSAKIKMDYNEVKDVTFNGKLIMIACPVVVSLTNEEGNIIYGNIEVLDDEDLDLFADGSYEVSTIGDTTYIFVRDEKFDHLETNNCLSKVLIEAYDYGATTITIGKYEDGKVTKISSYETFNISKQISVEINIEGEKDGALILREIGKPDIVQEPMIILPEAEQNIVLPQTRFEIKSDKLFSNEKGMVVFGDSILEITDILVGSYPVSGTYIKVNDDKYSLLESKVNRLKLNPGANSISVFSSDVMGNEELQVTKRVYRLNSEYPEINLLFYPHQYKVGFIDNNIDDIIYYNLNIPKPQSVFNVVNGKKAFGEDIFYEELERHIKFRLRSLFGEEKEVDLFVNENDILSVYEGTGDERTFTELLKKIKIIEPFDAILLNKYEGKGAFKTLTKDNIMNSKKIYVKKDNISITVFKSVDYIVLLQQFNQDIEVYSQEQYNLKFKLIDLNTKNEVRSKSFSGFFRAYHQDKEYISNDVEILFNQQEGNYYGVFDVKPLREFVNSFWDSSQLMEAEIVIQQVGNITKVIDTIVITLR